MAYKRISPGPVIEGYTGNNTFTAYSVICGGTTSTGAFQNVSGVGGSGNVLTSNGASALPSWQAAASGITTVNADSGSATPSAGAITIAGGTNITTSATGSTITITNTGSSSGLVYSVITADQTAAVNNGYICNKAGLLTLTLPTTSAVGSVIEVTGMNTNLGWKIAQNASQIIHFGATDTTTGTGGSLASTLKYDSIRIVCNVANLEWIVLPGTQGNITVV